VIVAPGMEAGGHRYCFDAARTERKMVGLLALLPAAVDAVRVPVVATGGIADGRGVAAALLLGASVVQIGIGFLRCPEAKLHPARAATIENCLRDRGTVAQHEISCPVDWLRDIFMGETPATLPHARR
jgi:nitronate monooxygenase